MKTYKIQITERYGKTFEAEADSHEDAFMIIKRLYKDEKIKVEFANYKGPALDIVDYQIEFEALLNEIIESVYKEQERNYNELQDTEKSADHIFLKIKRLKELNTYWR